MSTSNSSNEAFVQLLLEPSGGRGSVRPITSASAGAVAAEQHHAGPLGRRDSLPTQRPRPPKRTNITPVACQPCQHRKHKCDGARPVCTPCLVKGRPDCAYDAAGDQRRTSALKQRIRALENQVDDLKNIITTIGSAADRNAAVALAHQLAVARFRAAADVAHALRTAAAADDDDCVHAALRVAAVHDQTSEPDRRARDTTASTAYEDSPSSAATTEGIEFDESGETTPPAWMTDGAQMDPGLLQEELDDIPIEASTSLWPPDMADGSMVVDGVYPMQSDPGGYVGTGSSVSEMDGDASNDQTGAGMPAPFW